MKALIISLGGSAEPVAKSIQTHQPDFVCFFTSEQCVEDVGLVKSMAGGTYQDRKVIVTNINDLVACYERAMECGRIVEAEGFAPTDVIVDYTGGTKSISSALVLATVARGYTFSYVGGSERDKGGKGVVLEGSSQVHAGANPWDILAVGERRRLAWAFNHNSFDAARALLQDVLRRSGLSGRVKGLFKGLLPLADAYHWWDRFEHERIGDSLKNGLEVLKDYRDISGDRSVDEFIDSVSENLAFYNKFRGASKNFKRLSSFHVADLVGNARRRADEGKFDDAIARLYRALEMTAQVALLERRPPLESGHVPLDAVPVELREEFAGRYLNSQSEHLELPLLASFRLLAALGEPVGVQFEENAGEFRKILSARNQSILAHGVTVYDRKAYESFLKKLEILNLMSPPGFPTLSPGGSS